MSAAAGEAAADLNSYLRVVNRRKLVIVATVVVLVALSLAYSFARRPTYTASAAVLVPQQGTTSVLAPSADQQEPAPVNLQRNLIDDQQFAQGGLVTSAVRQALGYAPHVTVAASSTADVLTFEASSGKPTTAALIANTYAHSYIAEQQANQAAEYTSQVASLQASIAQLRAKAATEGGTQLAATQQSISTLTQSVQDLQAASNLAATNSGTVVNSAKVPTAPSSPKKVRDGIVAFFVGLILGVILAFAVDRLDDTVKSFADIEEQTDNLPVLGTIPMVEGWRKSSTAHLAIREDASSAASEAYRTLRTAIQFLSLDEPHRVIGVTSTVPDEGKTTTVANLALSFARAGQRVITVSFDFRKPRLHTFFGLGNDEGVTSVLLGRQTLKEAVKAVPGEPRLRVLASGPVPPNPAEILALNHVVTLVEALSQSADVVLIDCPPVLPVADTLLVSRLVDGLLVLTSGGKTKKADLRRAVDMLDQVQAHLLGTAVNRVRRGRGNAYAYGYGYGYGYGETSKRGAAEGTGPTLGADTPSADPTFPRISFEDVAGDREIGSTSPRTEALPVDGQGAQMRLDAVPNGSMAAATKSSSSGRSRSRPSS